MLHKTKGVVLKYFKYRDTSIIAKVYTEEFGLQSYIVNGVRSARAKGKIALFQPLTLLNMVVYKKPNSGIQRISEMNCSTPLNSMPYDIVKSSIGVFISEVLYKCIKEDEADESLFNFISRTILSLDAQKEINLNFHLIFLIQLSHYLGIGITTTNQFMYIDSANEVEKLEELINSEFDSRHSIPNSLRRAILDDLLQFYRTHIDIPGEFKSIEILRAVLK
ncbi:DNA repair protein RecO [Fulvivirga lutea]|uniref:DNA repair protein RecO n=1 Tax=Fulvivirga lutea TaxID=2810512 RepID=A0A975A123_9BACT|nr:DNA repair protein RecO [Fulvivirga lutea]QSE97795.1 DNA repair protein RecO [Fulvivirga lutea]